MLDTMTFTKIMGGLCGSLLVFLLGKWVAEEIYHVGGGHGGDHGAAYVIDTGEGDAAPAEEEEVVTLASLYPEADVASGERVFGKCKACHGVEAGKNGVGPHLYGVVGRDVGAVDGFNYSGALSEVASVWTPEELYAFLEDPKGYAPGTTMGFAGLSKPKDRANVIAYLDMTDGDMTEVAAEQAAAEEAPAATEEAAAEEAPAAEEQVETAAAETDSNAVEAEEATTEEVEPTAEAAAEAEEATESVAEEVTEEVAEDANAGGDMSAFAQLVAAADVGAGEKAFRKCAACHKANEPANGVGPHMVGVVGRDIASVDGFNYSDALAGLDGAWTVDALNGWLENPKEYAPGNKMAYRGVKKEEERANLIAYLATLGQ